MKSKNSMETKINKEGGDTMAAATKITQEQIDELIARVRLIRVFSPMAM